MILLPYLFGYLLERSKTRTFPLIQNLFLSDEKLEETYNVPMTNLDKEIEENTEIKFLWGESFFAFFAERWLLYKDKTFETQSRKSVWEIESVLMAIKTNDTEVNIWIKKPEEEHIERMKIKDYVDIEKSLHLLNFFEEIKLDLFKMCEYSNSVHK